MKKRSKGMTRRDFIKNVGFAAGAVGMSTALPKFLRQAAAQTKDHILIDRPLPMTGPVAAFTQSTPWLDDKAIAEINKDGGVFIKELGKKLPVKVRILDTESNPTKAAELASRLIMMDKVDIMYVSATMVSVFASDRTRASGMAIALWFFFVLVFDQLLLGALVVTGGHYGGEIFPYLLLANPADVFRILNIFSMEDVRTLYGLATVFPSALAEPWLLGLVMLAWIATPLAVANWRFRQ